MRLSVIQLASRLQYLPVSLGGGGGGRASLARIGLGAVKLRT